MAHLERILPFVCRVSLLLSLSLSLSLFLFKFLCGCMSVSICACVLVCVRGIRVRCAHTEPPIATLLASCPERERESERECVSVCAQACVCVSACPCVLMSIFCLCFCPSVHACVHLCARVHACLRGIRACMCTYRTADCDPVAPACHTIKRRMIQKLPSPTEITKRLFCFGEIRRNDRPHTTHHPSVDSDRWLVPTVDSAETGEAEY